MLKSHEKFYSKNGKRLVLVAEREEQARVHFEKVLGGEYLLIFSIDEQQTRELIRENGDVLSLVILHLREPRGTALKLLAMIQQEPELRHIPVTIVGETGEEEIDALKNGAIDFIPFPFPLPDIILARVQRTIELSEDRAIISSTERDPLTGLYNREYFYRYAEQYDHHHKDVEMDALVIDVNHFSAINERFGAGYGDDVLRRIGERVRDMVKDTGGIVCRREADTFQVYCPHGKNYQAILDNASIGLSGEEAMTNRVFLRMGVYQKVDKSLDIERRFDRANMAADTVRNSFSQIIGMYDSRLHEQELEESRLVEEFQKAVEEKQFAVFYQPKFDVREQQPILTSAEALVRWKHPERGMISPGVFIPLFEENGLIQSLDHYVWEEVARQLREWKDRFDFSVPISVNVSRVNMYDPGMVGFLVSLLKKYRLERADIYLEITESAYTEDSDQIIETVNTLRELGFRIEMDDFGSGYSSLNMISELPIDVLKLDMAFIRSAFGGKKNLRMLEIMLDIADYLKVPVVAEGVETQEQMQALQRMGCDIIQGYYFSKPVPPEEFERFLEERSRQGNNIPVIHTGAGDGHGQRPTRAEPAEVLPDIAQTLFRGFTRVFDVNMMTDRYVEYRAPETGGALRVEKEGEDFFNFRQRNLVHFMHPDDQLQFMAAFSKENLVGELSRRSSLSCIYRLMLGSEPTYINLRAVGTGDRDHRHIIVGISKVEMQAQPEQQHYYESDRAAGRDPLTGIKNMTAYIEAETEMNNAISTGMCEKFALAIIDMDGYRSMVEELGPNAADRAVQEVCHIVCDVFDHSPVYRIGDDEFLAILRKRDFERRDALRQELEEMRRRNAEAGGATFSFGMADYLPEEDHRVSNVFERANAEMYGDRNKDR